MSSSASDSGCALGPEALLDQAFREGGALPVVGDGGDELPPLEDRELER
jgi:hypothetical protein